jgi:hypothetical protein
MHVHHYSFPFAHFVHFLFTITENDIIYTLEPVLLYTYLFLQQIHPEVELLGGRVHASLIIPSEHP